MKLRPHHFLPLALSLLLYAPVGQAGPMVSLTSSAVLDSKDRSGSMQSLQRGHEALSRKDYGAAQDAFASAAKLAPQSPLPYLALAEVARIRNQRDSVAKWLGEALRVAPRNALVLSAWGSWHYARGDYAKAESFKQSAVAEDPKNPGPLVDLGDLYFNAFGKPEQAADFYRRALAIDPALGGARYALGMSLLFGGKADAALLEFKESARLSPGNPLPLQAIGRAHVELGDAPAALAAFDEVLKVQPGFSEALFGKGDVLTAQGKLEEALAEYALAVRSNPRRGLAHMKQGMALQGLGRSDEAFGAYRTAVQLEPGLAVAHNNLLVVRRT
jgi:tetratricopeptide (TPR) repeat protein